MIRGALGGMTAGINKRIRALGLNKDIEAAVLNAVLKRTVKAKLIKLPRKVIKRIAETMAEMGGPIVLCKGGKKWSVLSMQSYINKTTRGSVNLAKYNQNRNVVNNNDREIVSKLMSAGV